MRKKYYYMATDKDMKYNGIQFKIGKTYTRDSKEKMFGLDDNFHFYEKIENTVNDYNSSSTDRHFLIEVLGDIVTDEDMSDSNKIKVIREISREEREEHIQDKDSFNAQCFLALYTTNINLLEELAKDEDWEVLCAVAENINTPIYILEEFIKDESWVVRFAVAKNPNIPVHILEELAEDEGEYVKEEAQTRLKEIVIGTGQ